MFKALRKQLDKMEPLFKDGGKLSKLYPVYEMIDTILFTPGYVTKNQTHVRDGIDQKRLMIVVVVSLIPCILFALYNTGLQASLALQSLQNIGPQYWQYQVLKSLNFDFEATSFIAHSIHGLFYFLPVLLVVLATGGFWEVLFAVIRKHDVTEGFLVSAFLIALIVPATVPLWQLVVAVSFGIVIGKEIFGGVGFNFLNPALTTRAFLFFAYPAEISGDKVWVAVDGFTKATPLAVAAQGGTEALESSYSWWDAFIGIIPGSMGETSTLACILGAIFLLTIGIGSWRIMLSVLLGMIITVLGFNLLAPYVSNPMFDVSPLWHLVTGGFAFGLVFMATDPVSAAVTNKGKWIYGFLIGFMIALIRVINPAYAEGVMLAILFMNVFAPIIDYFVVQNNIQRRMKRHVR